MSGKKLYADQFTRARRLVWVRSRSQAHYRGEEWSLNFEDFCRLWPSEDLWSQRGRSSESLVLLRYDPEHPWSITNCCIVTRINHLRIKVARRSGRDDQEYLRDALWA